MAEPVATSVGTAVGTAIESAVGPAWWERLLYVVFIAFWRAYFDVKQAAREADQEVPDAQASDRALRFRAAVQRLRSKQAGGAGPVDPASSGAAGKSDPVVR